MATQAQLFRAIQGGRSRSVDVFWRSHPMSKLQRYLFGPAMQLRSPVVFSLPVGSQSLLRQFVAWLTRPTEFEQLREADALMQLLTPTVPQRCGICGQTDWVRRSSDEVLCTRCWERWSDHGWTSASLKKSPWVYI